MIDKAAQFLSKAFGATAIGQMKTVSAAITRAAAAKIIPPAEALGRAWQIASPETRLTASATGLGATGVLASAFQQPYSPAVTLALAVTSGVMSAWTAQSYLRDRAARGDGNGPSNRP